MAEVEAYDPARTRGGRDDVVSGNVVAAAFNHLAARPADNVRLPDPQLHTQVVLLNLTRRPDAAWRALNPVQIHIQIRFDADGGDRKEHAIFRQGSDARLERVEPCAAER